MSYAFDPIKWSGRVWKPTPRRVLPVVVVDTLNKSIDAAEELQQYNIAAPIEIYTISMDDSGWCLRHGTTRQPLPCSNAGEMALWLKAELENAESVLIPLPGKGYRPILCLLGLSDEHLTTFREGRTSKMLCVTDVEGPTLPKGKSVGIRQFYRNVDNGTYGPYHDKVVFSVDGSITIEGCETEYNPKLGLAIAACLSTGNCSLYGTA